MAPPPAGSASVTPTMRTARPLLILEGAALIALALAAASAPILVGVALIGLVGWLYLFAGMGRTLSAIVRRGPGFLWSLAGALIAVAAGLLLIAHPFVGLVSLTLVLGAYLVVDGGAALMLALALIPSESRVAWIAAAGALDVALGLLLLTRAVPDTSSLIGFVVAANLAAGGAGLILSGLRRPAA